ncbi:membrane fusion protein, multidrug efflux system [Rhizobium sp. RU36D]|nr:membrane fusion protein, multidrug efflux system [Rhizobium sp. RU36D]
MYIAMQHVFLISPVMVIMTQVALSFRRGFLAAGLTFLGAGVALAQQQMPPPAVTVAELQAKDVPLTYEYAARISAFRSVQVRARVNGILLKRNFTEGAEVKAGDVLFLIDPAPYEAALASAQAQLQQAQAQLGQAEREERRATELFNQRVGSEKSRDDAVSARELAEAAVAAAKAGIQTAELNLSYTKVTAPINGLTSLEQVSEGSLVGATGETSLLTQITQLDPVYVNFSFSDAEAAEVRRILATQDVRLGDARLKVKISFGDGSDYEQEGEVDFASNSLDLETGTLQARAVVTNPQRRLLPGQFVRATIMGVSLPGAIVVPEMAMMQGPQGQFVYTVDAEGNARINPVVTGQKVEGGWIVQSGLQAGDKVITEGVIKVRPGAPVNPTPAAAPAANAQPAAPANGQAENAAVTK